MNIVDLFAGGGGASHGIVSALGCSPAVAVNHDPAAIRMHAANHPGTLHLCEDVFRVAPFRPRGRAIDLLWASPDCTHHSRAKGGKPRENKRRMLAWVVVEWARAVHPRVIALENVPEFRQWGPLDEAGHPIPERAGETFAEFVGALRLAGYRVEHRELVAADYGAPTTRKRLYLVARCDGQPIRWPEPTHGKARALPHRTAAECIDWSIPVPSIFERARPLAEATQRRIAEGIRRYVLTAARPFVVCLTHGGRLEPFDEPLRTITTANGGERAIVAPTLVQTGYGEREGQAPRVLDIGAPLGTVVAGGSKHGLVAAFLAKHNGSGDTWNAAVGSSLDEPVHTVTGRDTKALAAVFLDKLHGSARAGQPIDEPAPTVTAGGGRGGGHAALVAAFLLKFYGSGSQWSGLAEPMHTIVTKARMGLVTVTIAGQEYALVDIGMRMLAPRELARAQGFGDEYILTGSKANQIARIGNSVCPPVAEAIVRAQFGGAMPADVERVVA
jgi:DNA (cytosine-5)-methyltransferase 1